MSSFHELQICMKMQRCVSREVDQCGYDARVDILGHYKRLGFTPASSQFHRDRPFQHCALYCDKVLVFCWLF